MNKTLNVLLCCAVALTLVSFAAAQDIGHMSAGAVLPPAATYTNCGTGCTSYNTGSGYFVTGTSNTSSAGQVLAEEFTNNGKPITKAIEANSIFASHGCISRSACATLCSISIAWPWANVL